MSDDGKFALGFIIVVIIGIVGMFIICSGLDMLTERDTAKFCQKFMDANLDEEFVVVSGKCSVLYHDVWVDVQSFDFLLPDLAE